MIVTPKRQKILNANGKVVRHNGITYRIIATTAGPLVLANAEQVAPQPSQPVLLDLIGSRSNLVGIINGLIDKGLVS